MTEREAKIVGRTIVKKFIPAPHLESLLRASVAQNRPCVKCVTSIQLCTLCLGIKCCYLYLYSHAHRSQGIDEPLRERKRMEQ